MTPLMVEAAVRYVCGSKRRALVFAIFLLPAIVGIYEIFGWSLTLALAPHDDNAYNGRQGDMFDPQKDMALAGLRVVLAAPQVRRTNWWKGTRT